MSSLLIFNTVNRLEIQSVMLVFSTGFVNHCPLTFSLVSSPPLPCVSKYTVHTYTMCKGWGGGWVWGHMRGVGLRQINTCAAK
jgi:hypothetical protein